MTAEKMRVYEIAREVGVAPKELIAKIRALGLEVNNHMSTLDVEDVSRVKRSLEKERLENTVTKRLSGSVLRRRTKGQPEGEMAEAAQGMSAREATVAPTRRVVAEPPPPVEAAVVPPAAKKVKVTAREDAAEAPRTAVRRKPAAKAPADGDGARAETPAPTPVTPPAPAAPVAVAPAPEPERAPPPPPPVAVAAVAEAPAEPVAEKRQPARVTIEGPAVVDLPGKPVAAPPPPAPPAAEVKPTPAPAPVVKPYVPPRLRAIEAEAAGPKTVAEVEESARDRFERELARARQQAEEREQQRQSAREQEASAAREAGRPEVGSIISLPMTRIKITERGPSSRQMPGQGQVRGRFAQQQQRGRTGRRDVRKKQQKKGGGKSTQITTPAEHKRVIRIEDTTAVQNLAQAMGVKATEVLKKLWSMGMVGVTINQAIDFETAQLLANEFGYEVQNVAFKETDIFDQEDDRDEDMATRSPVVTVMGHVDHGKTSLLDYIRKSKVAAGEAGGITQHVGAYKVHVSEDLGDIVFIDTPGHEAFTEMRARGAQATDIVVLVVAADDGVMPQTVEALNHAKDAKVTIIVAVNKSDLPNAQPDRVRQQLADHGLIAEEWGGETIYVNVSAYTGDGVDRLLESIAVAAEVLELRANPGKTASGVVIEAKLDRARGPMATVLVQDGTLNIGDIVVVGECMGKVRAMLDPSGSTVEAAGPSTPVELLGLDGVPQAGEALNATDDEKAAKLVVEHRRQSKRKKELASTAKISFEGLMEKINEGGAKELKIVLKADVHGSSEALRQALTNLSTPKVSVNVISAGVGGITESDVNLAKAGGAVIVGFHVRPAGKSAKHAEQEGVEIRIYDIIYDALDEVKAAMAGLLAPIKREQMSGKLEVRETFNIPKRGTVAGCMVTSGKIQRKSLLRVIRDSVQIYEGRVGTLRRFKDEASEVKEGFECGVMVDGFNDIKVGDIIETYEIIEEAATL